MFSQLHCTDICHFSMNKKLLRMDLLTCLLPTQPNYSIVADYSNFHDDANYIYSCNNSITLFNIVSYTFDISLVLEIICYWKQNILAIWNNKHRNNIQFDFIYFWMTRGFVFVDGKVWIGNIFFHKISLVFLNSLLDIWSMTSIDGSLQSKTI